MDLQALTEEIRTRAADRGPLGHRILFDLGEIGLIYLDGTADPPVVSNQDGPADATIETSAENLNRVLSGKLNPVMAYFFGQAKVHGSLDVVMKLEDYL